MKGFIEWREMFSKERCCGESGESGGRKPGGLTGRACALPSDLANRDFQENLQESMAQASEFGGHVEWPVIHV